MADENVYVFEANYIIYFNIDEDIVNRNEGLADETVKEFSKTVESAIMKVPGIDAVSAFIEFADEAKNEGNFSEISSYNGGPTLFIWFEYSGSHQLDQIIKEVNEKLRVIPDKRYSTTLYDGTSTEYSFSDYWETGIGSEENRSKFDLVISYEVDVFHAFCSNDIYGAISDEAKKVIRNNIDIIETRNKEDLLKATKYVGWEVQLEVFGALAKAGIVLK